MIYTYNLLEAGEPIGIQKLLTHLKHDQIPIRPKNSIPRSKILTSCIKIKDSSRRQIKKKKQA